MAAPDFGYERECKLSTLEFGGKCEGKLSVLEFGYRRECTTRIARSGQVLDCGLWIGEFGFVTAAISSGYNAAASSPGIYRGYKKTKRLAASKISIRQALNC